MDIWLSLPLRPIEEIREIVVLAEQAGVAGVTVGDHACIPTAIDSMYPYSGKRAVFTKGSEFPDPLVLIASLGELSTRIRFMTNVLLAPLHHPVTLARQVATAAVSTHGRLDLGVGVGWLREEFDALAIRFESRGGRLDEIMPLLRRLWIGEPVAHQGKYFAFESLTVRPIPPSPVPILVGGNSPVALRRAVRLGDGWVGVGLTLELLPEVLKRLRAELAVTGSGDRAFQVRTGLKGRLVAGHVGRLVELGIDALLVQGWQLAPSGTPMDEISIREILSGLERLNAESESSCETRPQPLTEERVVILNDGRHDHA